MKKITKLINGSIVVFVICLIAVLTLTSCDNTNSGDNLRKGQDTNITEVQGDEYQVTEKEFEKANSFEGVEYLKVNLKSWKIENDIESDKNITTREYNSNEELKEDLFLMSFSNILNLNYDKLQYDKSTSTYKLVFSIEYDSFIANYNLTLKYKNKKLIYLYTPVSYSNTTKIDFTEINLIY